MQILPNYHQAIANLSLGLAHRLNKYTRKNDNARKSPLPVHAARCERTSTSPSAVLEKLSEHLMCSYKCKEA